MYDALAARMDTSLDQNFATTVITFEEHISGHMPASQRATLLKGLGHLPEDTRGIATVFVDSRNHTFSSLRRAARSAIQVARQF